MLILRHILALVLALQIVNPMCKCDGNKETQECATPTPTEQSSCCSSMAGMAGMDDMPMGQTSNHSSTPSDDHDKNQDGDHICMCLKDPNLSQDTKIDLPDGPQLIDLPELAIIELPDLTVDQPRMLPLLRSEKHPPGPDIRVLYSSFQI